MSTQYDNDSQAVDLSQFDDQFEQAQESDRNKPIPDGKYTVKVEKAYLATTKNSGAPMIKWELEVLGPTQANRKLFRNNVMTSNPQNLSILKSDLSLCGLALGVTPGFAKLSDLPSMLHELLDVVLEVTVKTTPNKTAGERDNTNIYFNKFLGKGAEAAYSVNVDESVPF